MLPLGVVFNFYVGMSFHSQFCCGLLATDFTFGSSELRTSELSLKKLVLISGNDEEPNRFTVSFFLFCSPCNFCPLNPSLS